MKLNIPIEFDSTKLPSLQKEGKRPLWDVGWLFYVSFRHCELENHPAASRHPSLKKEGNFCFIYFCVSAKKMKCYCCSGRKFEDCCQPFIKGFAKPLTAEELMRSRYSAYAVCAVEYILRSTHPSTRKFHDREPIENWAKSCEWQKLEIVSKSEGEAQDKFGTVEFKAYFLDENRQPQIHHELSNFQKELGKWFFVDGKILKAETRP